MTSPYGAHARSSQSSAGTVVFIVAVLAIALIVGLLIWRARRKPERAKIAVDYGAQQRGIEALQQRDEGFDPAAFAARTRETMAKVNEAWLGGDMTPARRLLSDGVYLRFQTQLGLLRAQGLRNAMADWSVKNVELLAAQADGHWDTVHCKVVGEARDAEVPLAMGPEEAAKKLSRVELSSYHEVWSFIRRRGQKTKGAPALEGRCSSCGADLPLAETVRCDYCQAVLNSGEHDWVLAEITQPEEWNLEAAEDAIPGLAELEQRDRAVSRQALEDRASVVLWKWLEACATGNLEKLRRFVAVELDRPEARQQLAIYAAKLTDIAVGSVEITRVEPGSAAGRDRVYAEVRWSASVDGKEPYGMMHQLVLARSSQATTQRGIASLDCPVCRGPLANSDDTTCGYCGAALSGGQHEWDLEAVLVPEQNVDEA
ncbi:MAG: TIM44-like domain-containing protein [Deltaproteobacteria bacterium]|nr:TIM44-like domain-containing protein [Deltaproteobacteria bacterium]